MTPDWQHIHAMMEPTRDHIWVWIGFLGQAMFTGRFLVQWLASEKKKESVIPLAFWYFSIAGSAILLSYAVYKHDPVFILGQSLGFVIYIRNLILIHGQPQTVKPA